jgi:hypothetical protein
VLAFPPVRTIGGETPRAPRAHTDRARPLIEDVLPVLGNAPDPRILGMKQWILDLDYQRKSGHGLAVLDTFFATLRALLGEVQIELLPIEGNEIRVKTRDGALLLDSLSQGTTSILGWVAVLVQRLMEVHGSVEAPAIVVVDEIDAHMHPEWQQLITTRLRDAFQNVQFLVSSHSPFLAVGRKAEEILRLRRDVEGGVMVEPSHVDTTEMGVANVLTSPLFDLGSPLSYELQQSLFRKRELLVKEDKKASDWAELETLDQKLENVDATLYARDPLYPLFVEAMMRREGPVLHRASTPEEIERQRHSADEVLARIRRERGETAP